MPVKPAAERRHRLPKLRYRVTNGPASDAALRQRGSLTVWVTEQASAAWPAEPRTTPGGPPQSSDLAITTALTRRAVCGLALRPTEGVLGSLVDLLGWELAVPDHSTLSRRARTVPVALRRRLGTAPLHRLVDRTGVTRGGAGEARLEKHGTSRRRSWRKLPRGADGASGESVALERTQKELDDGSPTGARLDQLGDPLAAFPGEGADAQDTVDAAVAERHPDAAVIVPPRAAAVASAAAAPTQRDHHLPASAERGRMSWQKSSGSNRRARVEASIARDKRVIGETLRSRTAPSKATAVAVAVLPP